jgi:four helix bundle protein
MDVAAAVYRFTSTFPREEQYGLTSQMRRAAVSVPSNLAEGYGRGGLDYARFVSIAYGSLLELETQVELAARFDYAGAERTAELLSLCSEVGKMLNGLRSSLTIPRRP